MKTFSHLTEYLSEFFLEWEIFQINFVEKIKIHILRSVIFFRKSCHLWDNVENFCGARGRRWHYGGALHAGSVGLHARKPASVHPHPHAHALTHAPHTHTYINM